MIVAELDVVRVAFVEPKADAPLIIDRDRMLPGTITLEGVEPVAGRNAQVGQLRRDMHRLKLPKRAPRDIGRHSPCIPRAEELLGLTIGTLQASCSHRERVCWRMPVSMANCRALTACLPVSCSNIFRLYANEKGRVVYHRLFAPTSSKKPRRQLS